jgi:hypothetical protein
LCFSGYGFSDFKRCTERHRALTSQYAPDDSRKFSFGTPEQVFSTMERCWTLEPTSKRIQEDLNDLERVLDIIIAHQGAVVPEMNIRHGVRLQNINGGRVLEHKVTTRQRKHLLTMGPKHADAEDALQALLTVHEALNPTEVAALTADDIAHAVDMETLALGAIEEVVVSEDDNDDDVELNVRSMVEMMHSLGMVEGESEDVNIMDF